MPYASKEETQLAESLGYEHEWSQRRGSSFYKTSDSHHARHIWGTERGWQTADIIEGVYSDHEHFKNLTDALNRSLTPE